NLAQYISPYTGGHGCVRDFVEQVMRLQGKWYKETDDVPEDMLETASE
ncbi:MAG TPA: 3-deoxy-D-manno-octulosonate 8-phosphate phosphatase, partial [Rikenellaceae bacterium]|nr:3-deoxy-D-manno-octulosonate 8-phosphate phosphatase [Rikenellaceae bacterium]